MENAEGVINRSLIEIEISKIYKFSSGPFTQQIFKIIKLQRNKIKTARYKFHEYYINIRNWSIIQCYSQFFIMAYNPF